MQPIFQTADIVGTGAMGRGIAQMAAQAGSTAVLLDAQPGAAHAARQTLHHTWQTLVAKGKLAVAEAAAYLARVQVAVGRADDRFFNPVPLMRVAQVIARLKTSLVVCQQLKAYTRQFGHTPVSAQDTPAFIVNLASREYGPEALRLVGERVTDFAATDRTLKNQMGFRLGPFEWMDLTALKASHPVMKSICHQYFEEPRLRPSVITAQRLAAGLGVAQGGAARRAVPTAESHGRACRNDTSTSNAPPILVAPLDLDMTTLAAVERLDPKRTVGIDMMLDDKATRHRVLATNPVTPHDMRDAAHAQFAKAGQTVSVIRDKGGFVTRRVVSTIVNIAADMCQQGLFSPTDLKVAVTLGLGYPMGPLIMGERIGPANVLEILFNLQTVYGDPRYRPSPWLRRFASSPPLLRAGERILYPGAAGSTTALSQTSLASSFLF